MERRQLTKREERRKKEMRGERWKTTGPQNPRRCVDLVLIHVAIISR